MWDKFKGFFSGFFTAAKADPVSTAKGLIQVAAAGATVYGMATGVVPVNQLSLGTAAALATSGVHAIGTNNTGVTSPAATQAISLVNTAAAIAPQALTIGDHYEAIRKEAGNATATLAAITEATNALQQITAPAVQVAVPSNNDLVAEAGIRG